MTNEVSLKFLLDQLKALINEIKETNQKYKNTNEQSESIEDQMSEGELECLQQQFADAELYYPEEDSSHASDELAVPSESVLEQIDNHNARSFSAECTPEPVVSSPPTDLVLVCSASAPSIPSVANDSASGYHHCSLVDALTLLAGFASHAAAQFMENSTGYKVWKPGLSTA